MLETTERNFVEADQAKDPTTIDENKSKYFLYENGGQFGQFLSGLGHILTGIGAIIAFSQAGAVLKAVFEVKQITEQNTQVLNNIISLSAQQQEVLKQIKILSESMKGQLIDIGEKLKSQTVERVMKQNALDKENPTKIEVEKTLNIVPFLPEASISSPQVYLPQDRRSQVIKDMVNAKGKMERAEILRNSLKVYDAAKGVEKFRSDDLNQLKVHKEEP